MWNIEDEEPQDKDRLQKEMDRVSQEIVDRGLGVPALWFLDSVKPLSFLGSQAMVFFQPLLNMLGGNSTYSAFREILANRSQTEIFLDTLERAEIEKDKNG